MSTGQGIGIFLADTLITVYTFFLMLRALLEASQADFYNPISQSVFKITQPLLKIVRRIIPTFGGWDVGCWLLIYVTRLIELVSIALIQGQLWPIDLLLKIAALQLVELLIYIYIFAIFIVAIGSWFVSSMQMLNNPVFSLLNYIIAPVINPVRRYMPAVGAIDFSPLIVLILLYLLLNLLRALY